MPKSKNGFISIELVILASIMLTAGGYGISHLTNNAAGTLKMSDSNISRVINEMNGKLYLGDELANGIYNFDDINPIIIPIIIDGTVMKICS